MTDRLITVGAVGGGDRAIIAAADTTQPTGDVDIYSRFFIDAGATLDQWLGGHYVTATNDRCWGVYVPGSSGSVILKWSENGTAHYTYQSDVDFATEGVDINDPSAPIWLHVDVDMGTFVTFYYSTEQVDDPGDVTSWTQLGSAIANTRTGWNDSTSVDCNIVGGYNSGVYSLNGGMFRIVVEDSTGVLYDVDLTGLTDDEVDAAEFVADSGQTVTLEGSDWWYAQPGRNGAGPNWLDLPGEAGNQASTDDSEALNVTGDLDVRAKIALTDLTPTTQLGMVYKYTANTGFYFALQTSGAPVLVWGDGSGAGVAQSSVAIGTVASVGEALWIRATLDVDNGAGGNTVTFYTSDDGVSWTQFGPADTNAGVTSIAANVLAPGFGDIDSDPHSLHAVQILDGIDGTKVLDVRFEDLSARDLKRSAFSCFETGVKIYLTGDEWAYVRPKTSIAGKTPELLLEAGDGNKMYSPLWADRSGNGHHAQLGSAAGADTNDPVPLRYEGEKYLWLPGVAGNYAKAEPVNLLDADNAHLHQSIGSWVTLVSAAFIWQSTALTPVFGDFHGEWSMSDSVGNATALRASGDTTTSNDAQGKVPVSPGDKVGLSAYLGSDTVGVSGDADIALRLVFAPSNVVSDETAVPITAADEWVFARLPEQTAPAGTTHVVPQLIIRNGQGSGVKYFYDAVTLYVNGVPAEEFVPSQKIVGDLDFEIDFDLPLDFTPPLNMGLAGDWEYNAGGWAFRNVSADGLNISITNAAGTNGYVTSSAAVLGITGREGERATVRLTLDLSDTATGINWYVDGEVATVSGHAYTDIGPDSTLDLQVPYDDDASEYEGKVYSFVLRDGIGGPIVAEYRPGDALSQVDGGGLTWTVERGSSGYVSTFVDKDKWALSTDDYFVVPDADRLDFAADESFTLLAVAVPTTDSGTHVLADKGAATGGAGGGYTMFGSGASLIAGIADGAINKNVTIADAMVPNTLAVYALLRDVTADEVQPFLSGVAGTAQTDTTTASLANSTDLSIGKYGVLSGPFEGQIIAVALFREALTDDEIAEISDLLLGAAQSRLLLVGVS